MFGRASALLAGWRLVRARLPDGGVAALAARTSCIGRTHARTRVVLLVHDLHVRVVDAATGELLRELVVDPTKDYQPTGAPKGPPETEPARTHDRRFGLSPIS
jgi:hypothetical protein